MNPHQGQFQKGQIVPGTSYRVEELIGKGGMGSVYRVEHAELGRRFVLKALHGHLASRQDLVARLKNEWRALGKLEHPNIVQVTDAGQTEHGLPYYVMENLRGATLGQMMLARKRLGAREACLLVVDILAGLHAAHETGAVHRDIKPPNIFVVEGGRAKLLDFGIAKLRDQSAKVVTAGGISIGTPRYMAPEQASGTVVDGRADIYATALVLYEMVVGKGPFSHIRDQNELVMAHIGIEPERADFVDPRVPTELADLIQRWLSKSPSSRPANAEFARRELLALAQSLPHETDAAGDEVTVGGAYDASTLGALAPQAEGPQKAVSPAPSSSAMSPSASPSSGSSGGSSKSPPKSVAKRSGQIDSTLESGEAAGAELQPTVSLGAFEKGETRKQSAGSERPETLGWGTVGDCTGDKRERGGKALEREGDTPRPRGPSRRASVTPPPVSSLRPGGLDPNRTTLKWIGGTAAVSFLIAFGISHWLRGGPTEVAPRESVESHPAVAPAAAPEASDNQVVPPSSKTVGPAAQAEPKEAPETPPRAGEPVRVAGEPTSASGATLGTTASKAASVPPASSSSTSALQQTSKPRPAPLPSPGPQPASVPRQVKRSTEPRPAASTSKVGDQLPESGLW